MATRSVENYMQKTNETNEKNEPITINELKDAFFSLKKVLRVMKLALMS